jgi:hypothetical protein
MKRGQSYAWIPLWVDKWLWGSTRIELSHEERAIFIDLLALASKDNGFIRANETVPYPIEQLSGMLRASSELVSQTIKKCIKFDKLTDNSGILFVNNWQEYQLTGGYKRAVTASSKAETAYPSSSMSMSSSLLIFNILKGEYEGVTEADIEKWMLAYPACDVRTELLKSAEWLKANPDKKKKNYRRFIVNWLGRAQERGGSKPSNRPRSNEPEGIAAWYARTHGETKK